MVCCVAHFIEIGAMIAKQKINEIQTSCKATNVYIQINEMLMSSRKHKTMCVGRRTDTSRHQCLLVWVPAACHNITVCRCGWYSTTALLSMQLGCIATRKRSQPVSA